MKVITTIIILTMIGCGTISEHVPNRAILGGNEIELMFINTDGKEVARGRIWLPDNWPDRMPFYCKYEIRATESKYPEQWKLAYLDGESQIAHVDRHNDISYINLSPGSADMCIWVFSENDDLSGSKFSNDLIEGDAEPYWVGEVHSPKNPL